MPRYKFGPTLGVVELSRGADAGPPPAKLDVEVAFAGYTPEGVFQFHVPAYDMADHNLLVAVHVGLYAEDSTPPVDPAAVLAAPHHFSTPTAAIQGGGTIAVDATEAPVANYLAVAVLEFDA